MLQETLEFVQHLSDYVDGVTDVPPTPSLKKGVLVDIRLTREIEKWYKHERDNNTHCFLAIRLRAVSLSLKTVGKNAKQVRMLVRRSHVTPRTVTLARFLVLRSSPWIFKEERLFAVYLTIKASPIVQPFV